MGTMSKAIASNTTADMNVYSNTLYIPDEPTQEEPMPSWVRALLESMQALNSKFDQHDNGDENLESLENPCLLGLEFF